MSNLITINSINRQDKRDYTANELQSVTSETKSYFNNMSNPYIRHAHYQRHYQSMVLNLCSVYPYFDTDNFDRAYNTELASFTSQHPETSVDFCYYWTERVMWDRFGLSGAYGEFPGRYGGPGFVAQQQSGANSMPPTPQSAQPTRAMNPGFSVETLTNPSHLETQFAQPTLGQAPATSKAQATPASRFDQERIDLIAMHSTLRPGRPSQALARNLFEGFLNPQDQPDFLPTQESQNLAAESKPENPSTPQVIQGFSELAAESNPQNQTPWSMLAARLAFPGASNLNPASIDAKPPQPASLTPLPPLLLPELLFKDPTTGEMITVKMFERRSFSRGANTAIEHAQAAVNKELRLSKPKIRAILSESLTTTLAGIIEEHIKRGSENA
ncbi:hypothetical protein MFRU_003g00780 [Monilinia fructicola]|nr:hypothetical protein MFRU_003g00780 [Monilinia fructicola]